MMLFTQNENLGVLWETQEKYKDEEKYSFLYKNYELEYKNIMEKYQDLDKKNLDIIKQF